MFEILAEDGREVPRTALERVYGATLGLSPQRVAVNFVATIDGIVSFGLRSGDSRAVGGGVLADRLLMAMLRAAAGCVLVGAGTLRASLEHQWTPGELVPGRAGELAELRSAHGLPDRPAPLLVVSGSGVLPAAAAALSRPATDVHVLTGRGLVPVAGVTAAAATPVAGGGAAPFLGADAIVAAARELAGGGPVLCEGGPRLLGTLLAGRVPLDLFVTVAPQLAGRARDSSARLSLAEGVELEAFARRGIIRSVRRAGDHLLLRYAIDSTV